MFELSIKHSLDINPKLSEWAVVKRDVPQRSLLSQLLFLTYLNDIDDNIVSKFSQFGDDSKAAKIVNNLKVQRC